MTPEELSDALRTQKGGDLRRRRWIAGLSLFNIASMGLIGLFQIGIVKHVPEPQLPGADADKINGSAQAYGLLQTPDAFLAIGSYAATAALAAVGAPDRARELPWAPIALAAKAFGDACAAVMLLIEQPKRFKAYSAWCVLSAGAALAVLPLAIPEAMRAFRFLRRNNSHE